MTSLVRTPTFMPPAVPDNLPEDVKKYLQSYNAYQANVFQQFQRSFEGMITRKHAPILIPSVTIDAAHATLNVTAASAATIFNQFNFQNSASTTSSSLQAAVDYVGRGVLSKCVVIEKTSGGTTAYNASLKITIDGNVVYNDSAVITRQSQMRTVVGNEAVYGTDLIGVLDAAIGLPFNKECKIEFASDGTKTTTVAWKMFKKL